MSVGSSTEDIALGEFRRCWYSEAVKEQVLNAFETINVAAKEIYATLGPGYSESVYTEALRHELDLNGFLATREVIIPYRYKGKPVGYGKVDLFVQSRDPGKDKIAPVILIECKSVTPGLFHKEASRQLGIYFKQYAEQHHSAPVDAILINFPKSLNPYEEKEAQCILLGQ